MKVNINRRMRIFQPSSSKKVILRALKVGVVRILFVWKLSDNFIRKFKYGFVNK